MRFDWREYADEVDEATYDVSDDKLRIYSGRVSQELYDELQRLGFQRAYKQGCFFATWAPAREDAALALCGDVEDEQTTPAERAAVRAEQMETHSDNARKRGEAAEMAVHQITDFIPMGQPILVGHHSEGRARRDQERIHRLTRRSIDEMKKAAYYERKAAASLAHAERRERPDVVLRRIKRLEADRRKHERDAVPSMSDLMWSRQQYIEREFGYGPWDEYELTREQEGQVAAHLEKAKAATAEHSRRWIEHLDLRLAYERALYEGAEGPKEDDVAPLLEKGCFVSFGGKHWRGPVLRVNKGRDGQVSSVSVPSGYSWNDTIKIDKIRFMMSAAEAKEKGLENGDN